MNGPEKYKRNGGDKDFTGSLENIIKNVTSPSFCTLPWKCVTMTVKEKSDPRIKKVLVHVYKQCDADQNVFDIKVHRCRKDICDHTICTKECESDNRVTVKEFISNNMNRKKRKKMKKPGRFGQTTVGYISTRGPDLQNLNKQKEFNYLKKKFSKNDNEFSRYTTKQKEKPSCTLQVFSNGRARKLNFQLHPAMEVFLGRALDKIENFKHTKPGRKKRRLRKKQPNPSRRLNQRENSYFSDETSRKDIVKKTDENYRLKPIPDREYNGRKYKESEGSYYNNKIYVTGEHLFNQREQPFSRLANPSGRSVDRYEGAGSRPRDRTGSKGRIDPGADERNPADDGQRRRGQVSRRGRLYRAPLPERSARDRSVSECGEDTVRTQSSEYTRSCPRGSGDTGGPPRRGESAGSSSDTHLAEPTERGDSEGCSLIGHSRDRIHRPRQNVTCHCQRCSNVRNKSIELAAKKGKVKFQDEHHNRFESDKHTTLKEADQWQYCCASVSRSDFKSTKRRRIKENGTAKKSYYLSHDGGSKRGFRYDGTSDLGEKYSSNRKAERNKFHKTKSYDCSTNYSAHKLKRNDLTCPNKTSQGDCLHDVSEECKNNDLTVCNTDHPQPCKHREIKKLSANTLRQRKLNEEVTNLPKSALKKNQELTSSEIKEDQLHQCNPFCRNTKLKGKDEIHLRANHLDEPRDKQATKVVINPKNMPCCCWKNSKSQLRISTDNYPHSSRMFCRTNNERNVELIHGKGNTDQNGALIYFEKGEMINKQKIGKVEREEDNPKKLGSWRDSYIQEGAREKSCFVRNNYSKNFPERTEMTKSNETECLKKDQQGISSNIGILSERSFNRNQGYHGDQNQKFATENNEHQTWKDSYLGTGRIVKEETEKPKNKSTNPGASARQNRIGCPFSQHSEKFLSANINYKNCMVDYNNNIDTCYKNIQKKKDEQIAKRTLGGINQIDKDTTYLEGRFNNVGSAERRTFDNLQCHIDDILTSNDRCNSHFNNITLCNSGGDAANNREFNITSRLEDCPNCNICRETKTKIQNKSVKQFVNHAKGFLAISKRSNNRQGWHLNTAYKEENTMLPTEVMTTADNKERKCFHAVEQMKGSNNSCSFPNSIKLKPNIHPFNRQETSIPKMFVLRSGQKVRFIEPDAEIFNRLQGEPSRLHKKKKSASILIRNKFSVNSDTDPTGLLGEFCNQSENSSYHEREKVNSWLRNCMEKKWQRCRSLEAHGTKSQNKQLTENIPTEGIVGETVTYGTMASNPIREQANPCVSKVSLSSHLTRLSNSIKNNFNGLKALLRNKSFRRSSVNEVNHDQTKRADSVESTLIIEDKVKQTIKLSLNNPIGEGYFLPSLDNCFPESDKTVYDNLDHDTRNKVLTGTEMYNVNRSKTIGTLCEEQAEKPGEDRIEGKSSDTMLVSTEASLCKYSGSTGYCERPFNNNNSSDYREGTTDSVNLASTSMLLTDSMDLYQQKKGWFQDPMMDPRAGFYPHCYV